jgi:hypothetical protein
VLGITNAKELTMTNPHPIHALRTNLEAARFNAVEKLAAKENPFSPEALIELATIQAVLTAVRRAKENGPPVHRRRVVQESVNYILLQPTSRNDFEVRTVVKACFAFSPPPP